MTPLNHRASTHLGIAFSSKTEGGITVILRRLQQKLTQ